MIESEEEEERKALLKKLEAERKKMEIMEEVNTIYLLKLIVYFVILNVSVWYDRVFFNHLDICFVYVFCLLTRLQK